MNKTSYTSRKVSITHVTLSFYGDFITFTEQLDSLLGNITPEILHSLALDNVPIEQIKSAEGYEGLFLFEKRDHGRLLLMEGKIQKGIQYIVGNPLIAKEMTKYDICAGLYAPLRFLVYQKEEKKVYIDYDKPSDLFCQFGINEINTVGEMLSNKLYHLLEKARLLSQQ